MMISEPFSNLFESLKFQLTRMSGDLESLKRETKKLGSFDDSHSLREGL